MQNTNTSVLTRRARITAEHATLPYEAGWATEAVFFVQAEGDHPELTIQTEISPDGITWIARGEPCTLAADASIAERALTVFGAWLRVRVSGASEDRPARILIHANLKG